MTAGTGPRPGQPRTPARWPTRPGCANPDRVQAPPCHRLHIRGLPSAGGGSVPIVGTCRVGRVGREPPAWRQKSTRPSTTSARNESFLVRSIDSGNTPIDVPCSLVIYDLPHHQSGACRSMVPFAQDIPVTRRPADYADRCSASRSGRPPVPARIVLLMCRSRQPALSAACCIRGTWSAARQTVSPSIASVSCREWCSGGGDRSESP